MTEMQFSSGRALLIGAGADLPNTIDDATGLADILKDPSRSAYPAERVALLTGLAADRVNYHGLKAVACDYDKARKGA